MDKLVMLKQALMDGAKNWVYANGILTAYFDDKDGETPKWSDYYVENGWLYIRDVWPDGDVILGAACLGQA